jgi:hypothetical protein
MANKKHNPTIITIAIDIFAGLMLAVFLGLIGLLIAWYIDRS